MAILYLPFSFCLANLLIVYEGSCGRMVSFLLPVATFPDIELQC